MEQYKKDINNLLLNTSVCKEQVFDFSFVPYAEEFQKTFTFYRQTLEQASKWGVQNSYIFFINDTSANAKAGVSNGFGVIGINSGLIISLIINLNNRNEIDEIIKIKYAAIYDNLDNPANILLYQVAQHFTFYHELAHLIQKSDLLNNFLYERPQQLEQFSIVNHKLEMDADSFSALATAAHVHQYIFKIFGENIDNQKIESIIELFCSGVLLYLLSFEALKEGMYYEESTHPHPVIRILNVVLIIVHYCKQSPRITEKGIVLDHGKIIDKTMENAMEIEYKVFGASKAKNLTAILGTEKAKILNYFSKLRELQIDQFIMAEQKWNETVPKRSN